VISGEVSQVAVQAKEARLMDRGLTLKCLHCDSDAFHILYKMEPELGGVLLPRQSGSYECIQCGHVADEVEQEAMEAKIQREREAQAQGMKSDPEP
jgi:DNA-directed RNA polymerase subunit RPC12/RpoP